jgi:arginine decarboxylase
MPGQIVFTILARSSTNEPNRLIAASIGLARPAAAADYTQHGYLSKHHSTGETAQKAGDYAEDMAMEMLATTLGLPNDPTLT